MSASVINQTFALYLQKREIKILEFLTIQMPNYENERIVASHITKMMNLSVSRIDGFHLLEYFLPHFSPDILLENCAVWIKHCLNHHEEDKNKYLYLHLLGILLSTCKNVPDFGKTFVSDFLTPCIILCLKEDFDVNVMTTSLKIITEILKEYSSSCNPHKQKIQKYLLSHLDCSDLKIVELAAIGFFYSQKIGNAGSDGSNYVSNISLSIKKLCVNIHNLYDKLFSNEVVFNDFELPEEEPFKLNDAPVFYDYHDTLSYEFHKLRNCVLFLQILFCKSMEKKVDTIEILDLIRRGLSFHICLEKESAIKMAHKASLLLDVQIDILELLEIIFLSVGTNLMPYFHTIDKILTDQFIKTQNCKCFSKNCIYQEIVYELLNSWLKMSKVSFGSVNQEKLLKCIIKNCFSENQGVTLQLQKKNKNKDQNQVAVPSKMKINSVLAAIDTLNTLLRYGKLEIKSNLLQHLLQNITNTCNLIKCGKPVYPFNDEQCQRLLFKTIESLYYQNTVYTLPPLTESLAHLTNGFAFENKNISNNCFESLQALEKLAQPICSSLCIPERTREIESQEKINQSFYEDIHKLQARDNDTNKYPLVSILKNNKENTANECSTANKGNLPAIKECSVKLVKEKFPEPVVSESTLTSNTCNSSNKSLKKNIYDLLISESTSNTDIESKSDLNFNMESSDDKCEKDSGEPPEKRVKFLEDPSEDEFLSSFVNETNDFY